MILGVSDLNAYKLNARDGELGRLHDLSFDEVTWQVRHLVIEGRSGQPGWILMHPLAVRRWDIQSRSIDLTVTRLQVERRPPVDVDQPLSQRQAERYYRHFGWPAYWPAHGRGPAESQPPFRPAGSGSSRTSTGDQPADHDPHLHGARRLLDFEVLARDGHAGRVDDILVDAATWMVRQLAIDARTRWLGKQALVSAEWITEIDWIQGRLQLDLDLDRLGRSPVRQRPAPHTLILGGSPPGR
jgi:hypothetical protein